MHNQILEMLKKAEDFKGNEIIEIAKGKYQYTTNVDLFKKLMKWQ
jgi:hypothetical protein